MIRGIIFDVGGVLLTDVMHQTVKYVSGETGIGYRKVFDSLHGRWHEVRDGKISAGEFWESFAKGLEKDVKISISKVRKKSCGLMEEVGSMLSLAKSLRKKGYRLGIISNNSTEWAECAEKKFRLSKIFDEVIMSNYEGVSKPHPKIYRICLKRLKLKPEECVYIDNKEKNLKPAKEMGMRTILFAGEKGLKDGLKKLEVV